MTGADVKIVFIHNTIRRFLNCHKKQYKSKYNSTFTSTLLDEFAKYKGELSGLKEPHQI
jgi:hypothetical protein